MGPYHQTSRGRHQSLAQEIQPDQTSPCPKHAPASARNLISEWAKIGGLDISSTLWLLTTWIVPAAAFPASGSIREAIRQAIELPLTDLSHQFSILRATSSAVKSSPLFHFAPLQRFSVYFEASSFVVQRSNRLGVIDPSLL